MLWKALTSSAILLATLSSVTLVAGIPATDPSSCLPTSNTTSPSPQFVVYSDNWVTGTLPNVSQVEGYTVFALSFLLSTGALDENTRNELKSKYNAAGIKVVVSAFGSTETPTTAGADATKVAGDMATWVKQYGLDGIDVDYEDLAAMNAGDGKAEEWLSTFTTTLRGQLPQGQYILTHAPLAPWFSTQGFKSGAYLTVNKNVGDMIDWYNIQFYNQNEYNDCNGLLMQSSSTWPKSSLFEIAASGIDQNKLIIGKPATAADATNGYIAPATLATCLQQAKAKGWSGGAMVWQYPHADATWIKTVRSQSWAVGQ
ncbi:chitinase [Phellopilus nigrolimitatus]|nr:chitinase [Phellopilus nigrolimitatus]